MPEQEDLYLSAEEAAALLGISLPTLYAYVSRKNIRSLKIPGTPKRRYWAEDIQRLVKRPAERNTHSSARHRRTARLR